MYIAYWSVTANTQISIPGKTHFHVILTQSCPAGIRHFMPFGLNVRLIQQPNQIPEDILNKTQEH